MLDQQFCDVLEYKISKALEEIDNKQAQGFWCDGVVLSDPDNYYSQKFINDNRQAKMKAYVGNDGQSIYDLTLKFGNKSLSRYVRGLDILECIPQGEDWFHIDIPNKKIEILLD